MGVQLFTNGASSTLSGTLSQGGTTMTLAAGTGSKFPSITGSDFFLVTLFTKDVGGVEQNIEVVKVTARVGDTLTIVRDFENITGQSGGFAYDGTATTVFVHLRWTAASAGGMLQKSGNLAGLADAAASRANLGAAPTASPSFTGNVSLTSSGARILGDFSNATVANRVAFQSSVTNGATVIPVVPNGTATVTGAVFYNSTDPANAQFLSMNAGSGTAAFNSSYAGAPGAALPMVWNMAGVERMRLLPTGEVGIGVTPAVGQGVLQVPDINGAATSGFRNKIINGCMRISKKGNGAAVLGANYYGADGIITVVGGWSAISTAAVTRDTLASNDSRFTTGAAHYFSLAGATGSSGYVIFQTRIEAADVQELGGKVVTASARLHAWATAPSNYYFRIYKANAVNDFSAQTLVSQSASFGSLAINTTVAPSHTFTIPAGDCLTGLQVELVVEFTGTVAASTFVFLGDFQFCEGSKAMPFELRPIAIEEQLRRRYYQKQSVRVNTSSNWTCFPIGMVRTPTITGGGSGFTSTGTTADTLMCYQTTAAAQTLILDAEL